MMNDNLRGYIAVFFERSEPEHLDNNRAVSAVNQRDTDYSLSGRGVD